MALVSWDHSCLGPLSILMVSELWAHMAAVVEQQAGGRQEVQTPQGCARATLGPPLLCCTLRQQ